MRVHFLVCFQIISIFLIDTHTALDTFTMCLSIERFSSTITPRFVTMSVGVICVMLTFVLCFLSNHNEFCFFIIQLQEFPRYSLI